MSKKNIIKLSLYNIWLFKTHNKKLLTILSFNKSMFLLNSIKNNVFFLAKAKFFFCNFAKTIVLSFAKNIDLSFIRNLVLSFAKNIDLFLVKSLI